MWNEIWIELKKEPIYFEKPILFNEIDFQDGDDCCSYAYPDLDSLKDTAFDENILIKGLEKFEWGIRLIDINNQKWSINCYEENNNGFYNPSVKVKVNNVLYYGFPNSSKDNEE